MGSVMSYPARELRRRRRAWLRSRARMVLFLTTGALGMIVAFSALVVLAFPMPARAYVLGVLHAGLIATVLHLLNAAFLAQDQPAIRHIRGAWGEDNTRDELRIAKWRGLIWGWVDSITLQAGDIDHVVITRRGGVVVLDSKWRNQVEPEQIIDMAASADRAARRTRGVLDSLIRAEGGARHRGKRQPLTVTPAVVLWGSARSGVPDDFSSDGVRFVDGGRLRTWLSELEGNDVPEDAAEDAIALLTEFRKTAGTTSG